MKSYIFVPALVAMLLLPLAALAKPLVTVNITAAKEVVVKKDGKQTTKLVPTQNIDPGSIIVYSVNCSNKGDEAAREAVVDDPIPKGTVYIPGSATGEGAAIQFSIDGGKTFKQPSSLTYTVKMPDGSTQQRVASPEEYSHIRWIIDAIPAGSTMKLTFRVKVK
jgi:uncharacterized repeat protein (TIGR01451 family)